MPKRRWKRHRPEQIARKFRDVDVRLSTEQGNCGRACNMGISEAMYHCCRTQDGMKPKETKRSKELGDEKRKFRKIVADGLTADGRSDRYSRGVIVYERLTEERPFRGHHRMLLQQVLHGEPPSPPREWSAVNPTG